MKGTTGNPYDEDTLFASIALRSQLSTDKSYTFYFDSTYYITNFGYVPNKLEVNFGDGSGWHNINKGEGYSVKYGKIGTYELEIHVNVNAVLLKSKSRIEVMTPNVKPDFSEFIFTSISSTDDQSALVSGLFGKDANGETHTCVQKPFIILDGIDFGQSGHQDDPALWAGYIDPKKYYQGYYDAENLRCNSTGLVDLLNPVQYENPQWIHFPAMIDKLRNQGYDILFLDFFNGADDIRRNAELYIELIKRIYVDKKIGESTLTPTNACVCEDAVVLGPSMGGQVARYALTKMEHDKIDAHTRLYVSFDSPHKGANIPIGAQYIAYFFKDMETGKETVKRKLDRPAAKQLLLIHADASQPWSANSMRDQYLQDLQSLGNYPYYCRKIAISNGSKDMTTNQSFTADGAKFIEYKKIKYKKKVMEINAWALQGANVPMFGNCIAEIRIPNKSLNNNSYKLTVVQMPAVLPPNYDNCAGSKADHLKYLAGNVSNNGQVIGELLNPNPLFTFIPSISALDINTNSSDLLYNIVSNVPKDKPDLASYAFDAYFSPKKLNEFHTEISIDRTSNNIFYEGNSNWMLKEIGEELYAIKSSLPYNNGVINSNIYNFSDPRNSTLYSVTVNAQGILKVNANANAAYGNGIASIDGSKVRVHSTLCANVVIGTGGQFLIGENQLVSNIGEVYMRPGSSLTLKTGSVLSISNGSKLIIEPGAQFNVESGAMINLEGADAVLEINGQLYVDNGAKYKTTGNGYTLIKKGTSSQPVIKSNGLASIEFEGSYNEKRLVIAADTKVELVNISLGVKNCSVIMEDRSTLITSKKVELDGAFVKANNGFINKPEGIKLTAQSDAEIKIVNSEFSNLRYALDISNNTIVKNIKL
ncbi:MAG: hypothetical protein HYZ42_11065 [Bacteroidetes bacterium]|nr:hypothetical protein [Bacteroidota bacterium]